MTLTNAMSPALNSNMTSELISPMNSYPSKTLNNFATRSLTETLDNTHNSSLAKTLNNSATSSLNKKQSSTLTNSELETRLASLVSQERLVTREVLQLILLAEDRKLYLERGFDSLVRWLIARFGYSEPAAIRRVQAARLLRAVPSVDQKIQSGEVNLSTLAKAQSILKLEEKRLGVTLTSEQKAEVVEVIGNQSLESTERKLAGLFPESVDQAKREQVRLTVNDGVRVSLTLSREVYELLREVQDLLGHRIPGGDLSQVIEYVCADFRKRKRPSDECGSRTKKTRSAAAAESSSVVNAEDVEAKSEGAAISKVVSSSKSALKSSRSAIRARPAIPTRVRREVFQRDQGRCQFRDPLTRQVCGSRVRIEIDHVKPRALGGKDELRNLRCLCRAHNLFRAERTFGRWDFGARALKSSAL